MTLVDHIAKIHNKNSLKFKEDLENTPETQHYVFYAKILLCTTVVLITITDLCIFSDHFKLHLT